MDELLNIEQLTRAGIIEVDINKMLEFAKEFELPGWALRLMDGRIEKARTKTCEIMKALGIDPVLDYLVGHFEVPDEPDQVYTAGFNERYYLLIKGNRGEEELHKNGGEYYCISTLIVPINGHPREGHDRICHWINQDWDYKPEEIHREESVEADKRLLLQKEAGIIEVDIDKLIDLTHIFKLPRPARALLRKLAPTARKKATTVMTLFGINPAMDTIVEQTELPDGFMKTVGCNERYCIMVRGLQEEAGLVKGGEKYSSYQTIIAPYFRGQQEGIDRITKWLRFTEKYGL